MVTSSFMEQIWSDAAYVVTQLAPVIEFVLALAVLWFVLGFVARLVVSLVARPREDRPTEGRR